MRGSRSNSDGSVGKLRADPAPLSGLGEGIVISVWPRFEEENRVEGVV